MIPLKNKNNNNKEEEEEKEPEIFMPCGKYLMYIDTISAFLQKKKLITNELGLYPLIIQISSPTYLVTYTSREEKNPF